MERSSRSWRKHMLWGDIYRKRRELLRFALLLLLFAEFLYLWKPSCMLLEKTQVVKEQPFQEKLDSFLEKTGIRIDVDTGQISIFKEKQYNTH